MASQPAQAPERGSTIHLLSIEEAATYLNVPQRWVADAVRQRRIRCSRIGKHVRFRLEHLNEFVTACEQPLTAPSDTRVLHLSPKTSGRSRL